MIEAAQELVTFCASQGLRVALAESCTGGLTGAALTDVSGASAVFDRGFITYSNEAKHELLDVETTLLDQYGAVSEQVATAMAQGALAHSHADIAAGITGVAGPAGGTPEKPVGLVFIAVAARFGKPLVEEHHFPGNRANVREAAAEKALQMLYELAQTL